MAELKDANENPWYVLMTLYGEQEGDEIDWELHRKNARAWNAWSCQGIQAAQTELFEFFQGVVPATDAWSQMEGDVQLALQTRTKRFDYSDLPSPEDDIDLVRIEFNNLIVAQGFVFVQRFAAIGSEFKKDIEFGDSAFLQSCAFANCVFGSEAHFGSVLFLGSVDFQNAVFGSLAHFPLVVFETNTNFSHATFRAEANFSATAFFSTEFEYLIFNFVNFEQNVTFTTSYFGASVSFDDAVFAQEADFVSCQFEGAASFLGAKVIDGAFSRSKFGSAEFAEAEFTKMANFSNAKFYFPFSISHWQRGGAIFRDGARFHGAIFYAAEYNPTVFFARDSKFSGPLDFTNADVRGNIKFERVEFEAKVDFSTTCVGGRAHFLSSHFSHMAVYNEMHFAKGVEIKSCVFDDYVHFTGAVFGTAGTVDDSVVDFTDTQMNKPASFRDARFEDTYPTFSGAIFDAKTIFPWSPENWADFCSQTPRAGRDSCAFLRHHMAEQGLPEAEQFFFKREMHFASNDGSGFATLPYKFYGWVSDYGASIIKPVWGLAALWIIPALIYFSYFSWLQFHPIEGAYSYWNWDAFGYSFANIFKFFGIQRTYFGAEFIAGLPPALELLSAAQTVFGYILLFFLGLGLRSRFRLR